MFYKLVFYRSIGKDKNILKIFCNFVGLNSTKNENKVVYSP